MAQSDNMGFHFTGEQHKLMNVPVSLKSLPRDIFPQTPAD